MTGERQQCVRIYGEVELGLSISSILHGPYRAALSANKVLYGVLSTFIDAFHNQANEIDKAAVNANSGHLKQLRAIFNEILIEFEARERLLYASTALRQRGRVPLKLDFTDLSTITAFLQTDWKKVVGMDSMLAAQKTDDGLAGKVTGAFSKITKKALAKAKSSAGEELSSEERDASNNDLDADALENDFEDHALSPKSDSKDDRDMTAAKKNIAQAIKDVYHEAIHELLEVCDQSLLGFTALLELYRLLAHGHSIKLFDVNSLEYQIGEEEDAALIAELTSRPILHLQQSTEAFKRTVAMTYFHAEYKLREGRSTPQEKLGVAGLREGYYSDRTSKIGLLAAAPPPPPPAPIASGST